MKTFVTGGTGFIGTQFVKCMAQTDHQLVCLCRKTSNVCHLNEAGAELCVGDVTDRESLKEGMKGCDWVVNMANIYSWWEPDKRVFTDVNVEGTRNVMESALKCGVSKVVHVSTLMVYDGPHEGGIDDKYYRSLVSEYSRTKYLADCVCWDLYAKEDLPLVMVYPGGVLGAGDPKGTGQYIEAVVKRKTPFTLFEDSRFTYVHVNDVAEAILKALEKPDNIGAKYPVGNYSMSYREYNEMIKDITGVMLPKRQLPAPMARANAVFSTWLANLTKKPPIIGMSKDAFYEMEKGRTFDGSVTEKELGLTYTPIRVAIEEEIESIRAR